MVLVKLAILQVLAQVAYFTRSEEAAIAKSTAMGLGAALGLIGLAATPASADPPVCGCPGPDCGPWYFDHYCSPSYQGCYGLTGCYQQHHACQTGCVEFRLVCAFGTWCCGTCPPA